MSQLKQRVFTAIPLLLVLVLVLFVAPYWLAAGLSAVLFVVAAWEWAVFLRLPWPGARIFYTVLTALLLSMVAWLVPGLISLKVVLWIALAWWAWAFLWVLDTQRPCHPRWPLSRAGWFWCHAGRP
ncbi:MAG: hypothetical protein R3F24_02175 [Gammaproteobacteria bacterium]